MASISGNQIGSVYIRVRPDASGFRRKTQDEIGRKPLEVEVDVKVDVDDKAIKEAEGKAEAAAKKISKAAKFKFEPDTDGLNKAIKDIESRLKALRRQEIEFVADEKGLKKLRDDLVSRLEKSKVEMEFVPDEAGFQSVLKKIAEIRRQKLVKPITFGISDEELAKVEKQAQDALAKMKAAAPIMVSYKEEPDSIRKVLQRVEELKGLNPEVEVNLNMTDSELADFESDMRQKLFELEMSAPVLVEYTEDEEGLRKLLKRIDEIRNMEPTIEVDLNMRESEILELRKEAQAKLDNLEAQVTIEYDEDLAGYQKILQRIEELRKPAVKTISVDVRDGDELARLEALARSRITELTPVVNAPAAAVAAAVINTVARDRFVDLKLRVKARAASIAGMTFLSLAGLNTVGDIVQQLENVVTGFDNAMVGAGAFAAVVGSAVSVGSVALGGLVTVLNDAAGAFQLLAAAPTAMLTLYSGMATFRSIWGGMEAALIGIPFALEKLPPAAQDAVAAIQDLQGATEQVVQNNFWSQMNDQLARFTRDIGPTVTKAMGSVADEFGRAVVGMLDHLDLLTKNGALEEFARNNAGLFHNLADAAVPFFEAFMTLGVRGSALLPGIGREIENMAFRFRDFIAEAERTGQIEQWIRTGINAVTDLGSVAVSTSKIFSNLAEIFRDAGVGGLRQFARATAEVERFTASAGFAEKIGTMFDGAMRGAKAFGDGLVDVIKVVWDLDDQMADLLDVSGRLAGVTMSGFASALREPGLWDGVFAAFEGLEDFVTRSRPAFESMARIIGELGRIGGEVAREIAPGLNITMNLIDEILARLGPSMMNAVEPLTGVFEDIGAISTGPLTVFAEVLSWVVDLFNVLPDEMQNVITIMGMMKWSGMSAGIASMVSAVTASFGTFNTGVTRSAAINKMKAAEVTGVWTRASLGVQTAGRKMGAALSTAFSAMGGVPGLAIGGLVLALGALATASGEAAQKQDELAASLDQVTGAATEQTRMDMFDQLNEGFTGMKGWFTDLHGGRDVTDFLDKMGVSVGDLANTLAEAGPEAKDFVGDLNHIAQFKTTDEMRKAAADVGFIGDVSQMSAQDVQDLNGFIQGIAPAFFSAGDSIKSRTDGLGIEGALDGAAEAAQEFSPNFETMADALGRFGDEAGTASERAAALDEALQRLANGGEENFRDLERSAGDAMGRVDEEIARLAKEIEGGKKIDFSKAFETVDGELRLDLDDGVGRQFEDLAQTARKSFIDKLTAEQIKLEKGLIDEETFKTNTAGIIAEAQAFGEEVVRDLEMSGTKAGDQLTKAIAAEMAGLTLEEWEMVISASTVNAETDIAQLKAMGVNFSKEKYEAEFDADGDGVIDTVKRAETLGRMFDRQLWVAEVTGDSAMFDQTIESSLNMGLMFDGANWVSTLGADGQPTEAAIAYAKALGLTWSGTEWTGTISADATMLDAVIASAQTQGMTWEGSYFTAKIEANGQPAQETIDFAKSMGLVWENDRFVADLDANKAPADATIQLARAAGLNWDGSKWTATVDGDGKPAASAIQMAKLLGLDWDNDVHEADIDADPSGAVDGANTAKSAIGTVDGKTVLVGAEVWGLDGVRSLKGWIDALTDKTVRVNTHLKTYQSPVTSAIPFGKSDGGIARGTASGRHIKMFADGGVNYTTKPTSAHIAPAGSYVMYAESETGGEAFIPLSSSKRSRSLAIWRETGKRLNAFADGGINGATTSTAGPTFNIVNHYPQAEPTSATVNRALQMASAPGLED